MAQNSTIHAAKDFEGQTIGVSTLKDTSAIATEAWLVANGADLAKIHFVEMPFAVGPVARPRYGCGCGDLRTVAVGGANGRSARLREVLRRYAPRWMISGWFTTQDFEKSNAVAVKRFAQVIYATARWANTHRPDSAKILVKYAQLDPSVVRDMARCQYAENLDVKLIQPALDTAAHYGALDRPIAAAASSTCRDARAHTAHALGADGGGRGCRGGRLPGRGGGSAAAPRRLGAIG